MYFGSVKFFKNMLLVFIILIISTLSCLAIIYHHRWVTASDGSSETVSAIGNHIQTDISTETIDYQTRYEDFYAPQVYDATHRQSGVIYLTFDGGLPDDLPEILNLLEEQGVKATFFVSGSADMLNPDSLQAIAAAGHTIGFGSWSSDYFTLYSSVDAYLADVYQLFTYLRDTTGITPSVFRFPGGSVNSYNASFYRELIAEMIRRGFVPYDWNINLAEMNGSYSAQTTVDTVISRLGTLDRAIISLPTDRSSSGLLSPLIIQLQESGFSCEALQSNTKPVLFAYPE